MRYDYAHSILPFGKESMWEGVPLPPGHRVSFMVRVCRLFGLLLTLRTLRRGRRSCRDHVHNDTTIPSHTCHLHLNRPRPSPPCLLLRRLPLTAFVHYWAF